MSNAESGSSSSSTLGFKINARASATLCLCPPDKAEDALLLYPLRPTNCNAPSIFLIFDPYLNLYFLVHIQHSQIHLDEEKSHNFEKPYS